MRMMIRIAMPTEHANAHISDGSFQAIMQSYLADAKPEAAYFVAENGVRTAYFFVNMTDSSELPAFCEAPFLAYHAKVDVTPAMNLDDLKAAMPAIEAAVKKYAPAK
jgi:hypothetical protein